MSNLGPADTQPILEELVRLGLDDRIYANHIHHAGHHIADMQRYGAKQYLADGPNVLLHRKLDWLLRTYRDEWKLPPGRKDVLDALAKASSLGMK